MEVALQELLDSHMAQQRTHSNQNSFRVLLSNRECRTCLPKARQPMPGKHLWHPTEQFVRTKSLDESYREQVMAEVKNALPSVEIKQWQGAF